jgi:hypothetical protein
MLVTSIGTRQPGDPVHAAARRTIMQVMTSTPSLAGAFGRAVADKDSDRVRDLLHPQVDFRGMTPRKVWEADGPQDVIAALNAWFEDSDVIESVEILETDAFADRQRVGYRFRIRNGDGLHLVEQQAYVSERDGQIGWLRIMCSGYRPISAR